MIKAEQPVDHLLAGIGAARIFKKRLTLQGGGGKGRKLAADKIKIEADPGGGFGHLEHSLLRAILQQPRRSFKTTGGVCMSQPGKF